MKLNFFFDILSDVMGLLFVYMAVAGWILQWVFKRLWNADIYSIFPEKYFITGLFVLIFSVII
jgi:hypothetical protein